MHFPLESINNITSSGVLLGDRFKGSSWLGCCDCTAEFCELSFVSCSLSAIIFSGGITVSSEGNDKRTENSCFMEKTVVSWMWKYVI